METNIFPSKRADPEVLRNDNYADWSARMKNCLLGQGLWDIIETTMEPPTPEDDVVEFEAWKKNNDAALHAIQSSCGMDILSRINEISSAKIAWKILGKMFMGSNGSQDKLIPTIDDDLIIDEENSSSLDSPGLSLSPGISRYVDSHLIDACHLVYQISPAVDMDKYPTRTTAPYQVVEEEDSVDNRTGRINYVDLVEDVRRGDWNATRDFLESHPDALMASITVTGRTVLHVAVAAEREHIVEELVKIIPAEGLEMRDNACNTALHETITSGNHRIAECLIRKNNSLVSIRSALNDLPVVSAMAMGHKELARYLYYLTPLEVLEAEIGHQGAKLLTYAIYARDLDLALDLIQRCTSWAFALRGEYFSPLQALTVVMTTSQSGRRNWLKRWIYNQCVHISSARPSDHIILNINPNDPESIIRSGLPLLCQLTVPSCLFNLFGLKDLYEAALVDVQFQALLSRMCEVIRISDIIRSDNTIVDIIFGAISRGNFVFIYEILKANSELLFIRNSRGMTIFHYAVLYRQQRIFSLIYGLKEKNVVLRYRDDEGNTILHMAGQLSKVTPIDHITSPVLQMQREIQWFKEVESICPPISKELLNVDGLSAKDLFRNTHQNLRENGEKWMKETTTSGSVVATLIVTIMFAASFTIPGGNNQDTGSPIFVHHKLFKIFIIADSLSLIFSSTAVLMFLKIFTSRYSDEDFLISLPGKMTIGFCTLFISVVTMIIAFYAALLLTLRRDIWIVIPIISLVGVPILFLSMPFGLLVDMFVSTYGSGILDRNMKLWF